MCGEALRCAPLSAVQPNAARTETGAKGVNKNNEREPQPSRMTMRIGISHTRMNYHSARAILAARRNAIIKFKGSVKYLIGAFLLFI